MFRTKQFRLILCVSLMLSMVSAFNCQAVEVIAPERFIGGWSGGGELAMFWSHDPTVLNNSITRCIVSIHGSGRNADGYYDFVQDISVALGETNTTMVLAPQFLDENDNHPGDVLYWDGWREGDKSENFDKISNYSVLDYLITSVVSNCPNLTDLVIVGHSAGGQVVTRYAAGTEIQETLNLNTGGNPDILFVVANPSSYMYFNNKRWTNGTWPVGNFSSSVSGCSNYNRYKYGLSSLNSYMSSTNLQLNIQQRNVVYLLGELDTEDTSSLDTNCEAMLQGEHRLERGYIHLAHLQEEFGAGNVAGHTIVTVPGVGHKAWLMYNSYNGIKTLFGYETTDPVGPILYVDGDVASSGTGLSWGTALKTVKEALLAAASDPDTVDEIWVKAGAYTADRGTGARGQCHQLVRTVGLYGGFAGGETQRSQRNPSTNVTILSGDLNGDDSGNSNRGENSYHVVAATSNDTSAIIDGFTITGGNANFYDNPHSRGGGIYCRPGNATINQCMIIHNTAGDYAGGMYLLDHSFPVVTNCQFINNQAGNDGGAYYMRSSGDIVTTPLIINCTFLENQADDRGGAIGIRDHATPTIVNCTFNRNAADNSGDGIGGHNNSDGTVTIKNCIFYNNNISTGSSGFTTDIQDTKTSGDPLFVDANGVDNIYGTDDDNVRVQAGSPCINAGSNSHVTLISDLEGNPRIVESTVDQGAYELYMPGDFDTDGDVDGGDLAVWKSEYGQTVGTQVYDGSAFLLWQRQFTGPVQTSVAAAGEEMALNTPVDDDSHGGTDGDFDHDGDVDGADLIAWKDGYGVTTDGSDFLTWQRNFTGSLTPCVLSTTEYQAEEETLSGGTVISTAYAGYTGSGYVDTPESVGTSFQFIVDVPCDKVYALSLRYANGASVADVLEENDIQNDKVQVKDGQEGAQSFKNGSGGDQDYLITSVKLKLSRQSATFTDALHFTIGTTVNGGTIAGSGVDIDASQVTDTSGGVSFMIYTITFASPVGPLTSGTTYYLNFETAGNGKAYTLGYDEDNNYSNGTYYKGGSGDGKDSYFKIFGTDSNSANPERPVSVKVGSTTEIASLPMPGTAGNWTDWQTVDFNLNLTSGFNTLEFTALGSEGTGNIDKLDISFPPPDPVITSSPVTTATIETLYAYDVEATDPDMGDTLTYTLDVNPPGMTINNSSGLIDWTPDATQVGPHNVTVRVTDPTALFDTQSFVVTVSPGSVWPLSNSITPDLLSDPYGPRILSGNYDFHRGSDAKSPTGTPVYAAMAGTAIRVQPFESGTPVSGYGNFIVIALPPLGAVTTHQTAYLHMDTLLITEGEEIAMGQQIGTVGNSGTGTNTEHLHFEYMVGINNGLIQRIYSRNPLAILPYTPVAPQVQMTRQSTKLVLNIIQSPSSMDVTRIVMHPQGSPDIILDFNSREGMDPDNVDTNPYQGINIIPVDFHDYDPTYELTIEYDGVWGSLTQCTVELVTAKQQVYTNDFTFPAAAASVATGEELPPAEQAAGSVPETLLSPAERSVIVSASFETAQPTLSPAPFATAPSAVSAPAISTTETTGSTAARPVTGLRFSIVEARLRLAFGQARQGKIRKAQSLLQDLVDELNDMLTETSGDDRKVKRFEQSLASAYTLLANIASKADDPAEETRLRKLAQEMPKYFSAPQ